MRQRIIDSPPCRWWLGGTYSSAARAVSRLFDGDVPDVRRRRTASENADAKPDIPSFATWDESTGEYAEDEVLRLLEETRDCLRGRGFNAFLAIDVGISLDEMDAATQSIAFAQASNASIFIAPQFGDNVGVGIEIGSVLEDILSTAGMEGPTADSTPPIRTGRVMIATEPSVRSAMLGEEIRLLAIPQRTWNRRWYHPHRSPCCVCKTRKDR